MTSYFYPSVPSLYPLRLHLLRPRGYLPSTASPASTIVLRSLSSIENMEMQLRKYVIPWSSHYMVNESTEPTLGRCNANFHEGK
uniref:Uncharacterized protein n=1 Tax=Oryza nivara TaxID=4536 RepID=A0A0E0IQB2_ORYNI